MGSPPSPQAVLKLASRETCPVSRSWPTRFTPTSTSKTVLPRLVRFLEATHAPSGLPYIVLKTRVDWLTLKCKHAEDALMDAPKRLATDESLQGLNA